MVQLLAEFLRRMGPVAAVVLAVLLIIYGVLVIVHPVLVAWTLGIALILGGVAVLAAAFTPTIR